MYDMIIIGGGMAGLTAAIYARRANKSVLVLESTIPGGQMLQTEKIENYPGLPNITGKELSKKTEKQAKDLGAKVKLETVLKLRVPDSRYKFRRHIGGDNISLTISRLSKAGLKDPYWEVITDASDIKASDLSNPKFKVPEKAKGVYHAKAIVIASGTDYRHLDIKDEKKFIGKGVSFCATCDGALYKNKAVAVYGGGNSAAYSALYLADIASKVYLIHRRHTLRADDALAQKLKDNKNIELVLGKEVTGLKGTKKLSEVILSSNKSLKVDALFVNIGRVPRLDFIDDDIDLDTTREGHIKINAEGKTNVPGIYAAGDCTNSVLHQIVTSASAGAVAATTALQNLE
ncbi:MAG: FAD-dependent oxidoreductase [Candidatus Saccharibacteria bacterium]|nr:FAD-dependent oxidoreductase [Candidatus Saccharibacteria bacterium]